ncbi:imidazole glycerol phosphate synthase subunit HisH [Alkalicoccobacillus porphyridii]|uniref:Imidazole glycerol phosphate synthase subunit HisH n=1 Tax=Alkalicoccobacillus porphyridii TaxID=2597270 RepID=A0A554A3N4_9BACI|nr:imidazole glycerol phosphate synthase subunit HisH [Alkalicoccobacillus porphyridii]TSB48288.1 imidazole glycerol phosphate synthase subunit HisH [Alkalicoccobacillus porphyridii]
MIGIVDYGMGNLHSVSKAMERIDLPYIISEDLEVLKNTDGLLLPGVGAFPDAMDILNQTGKSEFLRQWATDGKPLMGICLGMQLLFEGSEEHRHTLGLGLLPGKVVKFSGQSEAGQTYKVPHMGWNQLKFHQEHPLLHEVEEGHVYFVHSFVVQTEDSEILLATSDYHQDVPAIVGRGSVVGTQFHPEKSSVVGMDLLANFGELVEKGVKLS